MELLYEGNNPPGSFDCLEVIGEITEDEAEIKYAQGRLQDNNYSLIVRENGVTSYFTPKPSPTPAPDPVPATTKQQILDQIAVLKTLADQLP